jgi:hypothetical protein
LAEFKNKTTGHTMPPQQHQAQENFPFPSILSGRKDPEKPDLIAACPE